MVRPGKVQKGLSDNLVGREKIERLRARRCLILVRDRCLITRESSMLRLHTYAGGRINATIAALLESKGAVKIMGFGDLKIDLEVPPGDVQEALVRAELRVLRYATEELGSAERIAALVDGRDRSRLAKLQTYLPADLEGTYLAERLFDLPGAV